MVTILKTGALFDGFHAENGSEEMTKDERRHTTVTNPLPSQRILKAHRPHPRNYPHTQTDSRHTDKLLRLVMAPNALNCTRQSRAPNIDCCAPENWPWPWHLTLTQPLTLTLKQGNSDVKKRFLAFDLDLWPMTLTYSPSRVLYHVEPENHVLSNT